MVVHEIPLPMAGGYRLPYHRESRKSALLGESEPLLVGIVNVPRRDGLGHRRGELRARLNFSIGSCRFRRQRPNGL